MNIVEMHVMFRQYAQQMGMQNVRAILPEQIDLLLNTSISDTVNQIITSSVGVTNDRIITDNSKIAQVNALRTLYKVENLRCSFGNEPGPEDLNDEDEETYTTYPFYFDKSNYFTGLLKPSARFNFPKPLYWVDFSINYKVATTGYVERDPSTPGYSKYQFGSKLGGGSDSSFVTNYFPVRLIDDSFLADCLNDFILKNRLRSPILTIVNNEFNLYIDKFKPINPADTTKGVALDNALVPYDFRVSYIAKPAIVVYNEDMAGSNVDCDLPDYLHIDVVKHAVDLYRLALTGSLYANQEQQKNQERENYRNNARQEN